MLARGPKATSLKRLGPKRVHSTSCPSNKMQDLTSCIQTMYGTTPRPVVSLLLTGAGMQAVSLLLCTPGASSSIMSVEVPYSRASSEKLMLEYLGPSDISTSVTSETALKLAHVAYKKCCETMLLDNSGNINEYIQEVSKVVGVGCTAALVSTVPKKGDHRCHVSVYSNTGCDSYSITLNKGQRDRLGEDLLCSQLVIEAVMKHTCPTVLPASALLNNARPPEERTAERPVGEQITTANNLHGDALERIYDGKITHALFLPRHGSGMTEPNHLILDEARLPPGTLIYPGSYNPLHEGHLALARAALVHCERELARDGVSRKPLVVFEMSALNADKPPLPRDELLRRLGQFDARTNPLLAQYGLTNIAVCITSEPLFLGKSSLFPQCNFVIGADTLVRLVNGKYYQDKVPVEATTAVGDASRVDGDEAARRRRRGVTNMVAALTRIAASGCRFIVGGRLKALAPTINATTGISGADTVYQTCEGIMRESYHAVTGAAPAFPVTSDTTIAHAEQYQGSDMTVADTLPQIVVGIFVSLSEEEFRLDLSSTELRTKAGALDASVPVH